MESQIHQRMRALEERLDNLDIGDGAPVADSAPSALLEPVPAAAVIAGQPTPSAANFIRSLLCTFSPLIKNYLKRRVP